MKTSILIAVLSAALGCAAADFHAGDLGTPKASQVKRSKAGTLELVVSGKSDYVIAGNTNDLALVDLQAYIEKMTAVKLPLVDALSNALPEKAIVVTSDAAGLPFKPGEISTQGYLIRVVGSRVYIYSTGDSPDALKPQKQRKGRPRGLQFGVYGLLDEFFGCRFLTPTVEVVPKHGTLALPDDLNAVREPAFRNRIFTSDQRNSSKDVFWRAKNRVGHEFYGFTGHTLYNYLPPEKYFKAHPEWYPEANGVRGHKTPWFCWSNKEMLKALIEACRAELRKGKTAPDRAFPLGQGDGPARCSCAACEKIREEYGTDSASYLLACNEIARALEAEFPTRKISVSAYFNTQLPPLKAFKMHKNITVDYTRTGDHMKSLFHPRHAKFAKEIARWDDFVDEISVWDWSVNFGNTLMPFPNIKARADDIRFMRTIGRVKTMAPQVMAGGDFIELREWVFARMMWDVSWDVEALEREFMLNYYGPDCGRHLLDYILKFQKYAEDDPGVYNAIFGGHPETLRKTLYTPVRVAEGERLFRRAMDAADRSGDTNLAERVRLAYLRGFAAIRLSGAGELKFCEKDGRRFLLPGGDVTLADAVTGVGDLIYRNLAKTDEFGDNLFQSAKFHSRSGVELDSRVENDCIVLDSASALSGSILRLVDKASGCDILAVDAATMSGNPGLRHLIGCRSAVNRRGKITAVKGGREFRTYGSVSPGIWWTPDIVPIERVFKLADGERGFRMSCSYTEKKALRWYADTFKVGKPHYLPQLSALLVSSAPTKAQICVSDGKRVRRSSVQAGMPFVVDLASNAPTRTVWIVDADLRRPVVRLDVSDPFWNRLTITAEKKISALRVSLAAGGKLTLHVTTNRVDCGRLGLHLVDRGDLPPALSKPAAASKKIAEDLRLGRRKSLSVGSDGADVATFEEAFALLPQTAWSNDVTLVVRRDALAYTGASLSEGTAKAIGAHRLVIRGDKGVVVRGVFNFAGANATIENVVFENPGKRGRSIAVNRPGRSPVVRNCTFRNFHSGMEDRSYAAKPGLLFENCMFEDCDNGILYIANGGTPRNPAVIRGCTFRNCRTGLYYSDNANLHFFENTFVDSGVRLDRNPKAVFTRNRFLGGKTSIRLVYAKGKAADGMVFTHNVFDRCNGLMLREKEVWDLAKVNAYFGTDTNTCKSGVDADPR